MIIHDSEKVVYGAVVLSKDKNLRHWLEITHRPHDAQKNVKLKVREIEYLYHVNVAQVKCFLQ